MTNPFDEKNFDESAEMTSMTVDWGVPGDYIIGTFIKSRHGIETQYGTNSIYEIVAEKGSYHKLIGKGRTAKPEDTATEIHKDEVWNVWGRNEIFNGQMNSLKPGQAIKISYVEDRDGANGPWKNIKIFAPKDNEGKPMMNEKWLEEQGISQAFGSFEEKKN